ncbi:hypothetical protein SF23_08825, partial [Streptomyces sp. MBRL 10]
MPPRGDIRRRVLRPLPGHGPPASAAEPPTGSAPSAPFRPRPSSARPGGAGNSSTRSGPTPSSTPRPWCPGRRTRPDGHRPAAAPARPGR